jgi:pimeloyl-ACP methyl ester carboxylesterase
LLAAGLGPIRAINLEPLDADIDAFATQMTREVSALRSEAPDGRVAVIAHSMGGLVARAAMRRGAAESISHLVTLATPHHGSVLARFVPGPAGAQLLPSSSWLQALNAAANPSSVRVTSIFSRRYLLFPRSAMLNGAELHAVQGVGHFGLLRSRRALDHVLAALVPAHVQTGRAP